MVEQTEVLNDVFKGVSWPTVARTHTPISTMIDIYKNRTHSFINCVLSHSFSGESAVLCVWPPFVCVLFSCEQVLALVKVQFIRLFLTQG